MSNRLMSIFILLFTFWAVYGFYYYFFVLNKWNVTLNSNIWEYQVALYNDKLKTNFITDCLNQKCELIDLAPFDYEITITKEWYKTYKKSFKVISKSTINIDFQLEKQLFVKKVDFEQTSSGSQLDKFREISQLQKSYKFFNMWDLGYFYFEDNGNDTITLYRKYSQNPEENLYTFNKISSTQIDLQILYQTENMIFISYWDEKYTYNLQNNKIEKIFFPQEVNYAKKSGNILSFVNDVGVFLYDENTKNIEYFYLFKDFVLYDDKSYFWVIFDDEIEKKKNYNLENKKWNLIVKYDFKNKSVIVLETTELNVKKIVKEAEKVYFYNEFDDKFLVENIQ